MHSDLKVKIFNSLHILPIWVLCTCCACVSFYVGSALCRMSFSFLCVFREGKWLENLLLSPVKQICCALFLFKVVLGLFKERKAERSICPAGDALWGVGGLCIPGVPWSPLIHLHVHLSLLSFKASLWLRMLVISTTELVFAQASFNALSLACWLSKLIGPSKIV